MIDVSRGSMPEPLNKVLEPVSVLHLDMPDDADNDAHYGNSRYALARHGSIGTVEDPGVIGPVVWNMHCQRLQHGMCHKTLQTCTTLMFKVCIMC